MFYTKLRLYITVALLFNIVNVLAYDEVENDEEIYANYAEEINISEVPFSLKGEYDVYNTTDNMYYKCFKIYLTPEDKLDIKNSNGTLVVTSQYEDVIFDNSSRDWNTLPTARSVQQGKYKEGFYYFLIYNDTEGEDYNIQIVPYLNPEDAVSSESLSEDKLIITNIEGNMYSETSGYFGNENCTILDYSGAYYFTLIYKCEMKAGDIFSTHITMNPAVSRNIVFVEIYNSEFENIKKLDTGKNKTEDFTADIDGVYYFFISPSNSRDYSYYNAFELNITRINTGTTILPTVPTVDIKVHTQNNNIIVENPCGEEVSVYDISGRCLSQGKNTITVPQAGIYIVKAGTTIEKIVIR